MKHIFLIGPIFFTITVIILTFLQYDFERNLGWHPIYAVTLDWPSGLALGPYGWWTIATFILSGLILFSFGLRLFSDLGPGAAARAGSALLAVAGLCLAGLAFKTDPTFRSYPLTWHGFLHDFFFVLLGFTLLLAMLFLGKAFRGDPRWHHLGAYTWATAAISIPAFFLKGFAFYIFLLSFLIWNEVIAVRYYQCFKKD
ncbi:MAG: DUF998 domain-containing protein [Chloroflexota bacterium]